MTDILEYGDAKALYVDDDEMQTELISELSEDWSNVEVWTLNNPDEVAYLVNDLDPDVVVTDYDMPEKNGIELYRDIKDEHSKTPFILYTGKGSEEIASEAISAGFTDYLQKNSGEAHYERLKNRVENAAREKRRKSEIERQSQILDEFAETLAHDLRNPLQVAYGKARDLEKKTGKDGEVTDSLERMEQILDGAVQCARAGSRVNSLDTSDISKVAEEAWEHVDTNGASLGVYDIGEIEMDEKEGLTLFENLYANSIKHGGREAINIEVGELDTFHTSTRADPDVYGFYIEDDGQGLPEEADNLFELGFTTDKDGTGFGLSIVRQIADAHDWNLRTTNSETGGARFEFTV